VADLWFGLVALLLGAYIVLDGFDLGAGAIHRVIARDDGERRAVIAAIGPFWDGNEVFLLAAGGTLFLAFSDVLARALSGLYLAVVLVLWAMLLRGIAIELRSHLASPLWRGFWDVVFQLASGALALLLGVAGGAVLRGFPLQRDGWFALELFSVASPRLGLGVIDGYTLATGAFSLLVLGAHGARFVALRTPGPVGDRAARLADRATLPIAVAWAIVTALSFLFARPAMDALLARPAALALPVAVAVALGVAWDRGRRGQARAAFAASAVVVAGLVGVAAVSAYPVLLRSTSPDVASLTVATSAGHEASLRAGLRWWFFAAGLVALYFANLFRVHGGPATAYGEGGDEPAEPPPSA
jgi:cytochrome d ubiquinol oxidase subunit II